MEKAVFECPVCMEIPGGPIYQCKEGHTICGPCSAKVDLCPQCREPYGDDKIRNRTLEALIEGMQFKCSFKEYGCPQEFSRIALDEHHQICKFRPFKLCDHLGLKCHFSSRSPTEVLNHLLRAHNKNLKGIKEEGEFNLREDVDLITQARKDDDNNKVLTSALSVTVGPQGSGAPTKFLFCRFINVEKGVYSAFILHFGEKDPPPFIATIKYTAPTKDVSLTWSGRPTSFTEVESAISDPPITIRLKYFVDKMVEDGLFLTLSFKRKN